MWNSENFAAIILHTLTAVGDRPVPVTPGDPGVTPALLMEDVAIVYPRQGRRAEFRAVRGYRCTR